VAVEAVRARAEHGRVLALERRVQGGHLLQLRGADEGEVARIEEEHDPPAAVVGEGDRDGVGAAADVGVGREVGGELAYADRHW
jgi:hypothetical protein